MATSSLASSGEARPTLLALDGYSLMFRAFFAMPPMQGESGPTNALFGFFRMLVSAVRQFSPTYLAVALDHPSPTFRDDLFADYKGGRATTPDELRFQLEAVRGLLQVVQIPAIELAGFEADDVIATLTRLATADHVATEIVTGDRDILQLVADPLVRVHLTRQGVSNLETMDEGAVIAKYGVAPKQYGDFALLRGDKSDNLPGVRGIGAKTAAQLISRFGDIDTILAERSSLPARQREALDEAESELGLLRQLVALDQEAPISIALSDLALPTSFDVAAAEQMFVGSFGLRGVFASLKELFDVGEPAFGDQSLREHVTLAPEYRVVATPEELLNAHPDYLTVSARFAGEDGRVAPRTLGFGAPEPNGATPVWFPLGPGHDEAIMDQEVSLEVLNESEWVGIGLKETLRSLALTMGTEVAPSRLMDLGVLAYVLDSSQRRSDLREVAHLIDIDWPDGSADGLFDDHADQERMATELAVMPVLLEGLLTRIQAEGVQRLAMEVEIPLVGVLTKMEVAGAGVDTQVLEEIGVSLAAEASSTLGAIHAYTGDDFNPNSPKQLGTMLFEKLGLPTGKRTKTGYSTDARVLEGLRDQHPLVSLVLKFRELDKLRSTFYEGLRAEIAADGRIHATFNQTVARTGRISSEHPNLQNIPVRSEEGRRFRRVFVAPRGAVLVAADYSQIELRILAHLSNDERLIEVLSGSGDVHAMVAASIYGIEASQVSYEQRAVAKMVAYGLSYGMESYGLASRLGISSEEADAILASFFAAYPGLVQYRESVIREARERGYTTTLLGRRRYLPELQSPNRAIRQGAERQAMNAPTQGLAADIFKMALVALDERLLGTNARLVLQIHDEVVVEAPEAEATMVQDLVRESLAGVYPLAVPLIVNVGIGANWAEARA